MQMLLAGARSHSTTNRTVQILNPATGDVIDEVPDASDEDVETALRTATAAFPAWAARPAHERSEILVRFARGLLDDQEELANLLARENGKTVTHARLEIASCARLFEKYANEALRLYGQAIPGDFEPGYEQDLILTRRYPYGVMVAITPFNFPVSLFSTKVAPALASGNVVIGKPSEETPLTTLRVCELLYDAGLPPETLQVLTGDGRRIGRRLLESERVNLVSFTGSIEVGQQVNTQRARHISPTHLELGGNDPMIVCNDADIDLVVEHAWFGRTLENGQCCAASKRFIVEKEAADDFESALEERLLRTTVGDPFDDGVDLGPLINDAAARRAEEQIALTVDQGATVKTGSARADQRFVQPTMLVDVTADMDIAHDLEVFAPVFPVLRVESLDQAVAIANDSTMALHASVFSRDIGQAIATAHRIDGGLVAINGTGLYKPDAIPFGGWKLSGTGREGLVAMAEQYTQEKTIAVRDVLG